MNEFMDSCCSPHHKHSCDCRHHCRECHCSPFHLRLAGLQGNLNFQLFRFKGCPVTIELECKEGKINEVKGKICNVGTDFVDILQDNKTVVTVLLNRICKITWPNKDCSPCKKCNCHKCRPHHCICD